MKHPDKGTPPGTPNSSFQAGEDVFPWQSTWSWPPIRSLWLEVYL